VFISIWYIWNMIRGLTQQELARRTGFTQPRISDYMTGKKAPSDTSLMKLAEAMDMDPAELSKQLMLRRTLRKGKAPEAPEQPGE
jgi:transcriptional regulator with XRE-family HTH domain